jgi:hypothetical protein
MSKIFTEEDLDRADALRASGKKWDDVEAVFGDGIKNACSRRARIRKYDEEEERKRFDSVLRDQHGITAAWCSEQREYKDPTVDFAWQVQKTLKMRELSR